MVDDPVPGGAVDLAGVTADSVMPPLPSRDAVVAFTVLLALVIGVAVTVYAMGAPSAVATATAALISSDEPPPALLARALARTSLGGQRFVRSSVAVAGDSPLGAVVMAGMSFWALHEFINSGGLTVFSYLLRVAGVGAGHLVRHSFLLLRRAPGRARDLGNLALVLAAAYFLNAVIGRGMASPTEGSVSVARSIIEGAPVPAVVRQAVVQECVARHNVAFLGNFLSAESTHELACDLGTSDPQTVALWDSGAAINASVGRYPVVPGSVVANSTYVSTANGLCLPPTKCTQLLPTRRRDGKRASIPLTDSVVLDSCQHTLCAAGKLAAEDGIGLMLAPYDGDTFLFTSWTDRTSDIPLLNLGVLVVPDAAAASAMAVSHGHIQNDATRSAENLRQTFNHAPRAKLQQMPSCTHAPETWAAAVHDVEGGDHAWERANARRVKSTGHVPVVGATGDCMSMDGWSNSVPHVHGGQRHVLGTFDLHSRLDRSYLMHAKSDAPACIETHMAWNNSLGVRYKRCHTDNAPDLIKGDSGLVFRRWGTQVTTAMQYEPRQNGQMERRWVEHTNHSRWALEQARFLDDPSGEAYWWYAWRDAEMKSWCMPFQRDGTWTCPWLLHTGHRPNPTVHRPFGMLCYAKQYHPQSKTSARGIEARVLGYSVTQKGWILLDVRKRTTFMSPHVHFCWGEYPGLRPVKQGGGTISPSQTSNDAGASQNTHYPGMPPPTDHSFSPPPPPQPPPPPFSPDPPHDSDGSDGDEDDGGDGGDGGVEPPIAQRLNRRVGSHPHGAQRGEAMTAQASVPPQSTDLSVPDGVSFVVYLCAGEATGEGTIAHNLRASGLYTVMVDVKQGGYGHDMTHGPIQNQVSELAMRPQCVGVISSVPCGSYSVLRYVPQANAPGVERRRPHHVRGIPRADGSLAPSVILGNTLLDFAIHISEVVIGHGGFALFESPVSRAAGSQHAIPGREDHAAMWDDEGLAAHLLAGQYGHVCFDQCCTREHPAAQKTTQLSATPGLDASLRRRFGSLRCRLPKSQHTHVPGGPDANGAFQSEQLSRYSPEMNRLVAEAVVEHLSTRGAQSISGPFPSDPASGRPPQVNLAKPSESPAPTLADRELQIFHDAGYTIKLHEPDYFLGCNVEGGKSDHHMTLSMRAYVTQLASKYLPKPLDKYASYATPSTKELVTSYEKALLREETPSPELLKSYGSKCGAAIFAAPAARYDCAYTIGVCARCITFPTAEMDAHLDRCIAFMAQRPDVGIRFDGTAPGADRFHCYSDSDWGTSHSTAGWCAMYGNATVGYASKRQHSIALSSTEAEVMAASLAGAEIVFMRGLLQEMGVDVSEPTVLYVDNLGAVALAKDRRSCHRSRHIERRYLKIREWVAHGLIRVEYKDTNANASDLLTKPLERLAFERHTATLGGTAPAPASVAVASPLHDWELFYADASLRMVEDEAVVAQAVTAGGSWLAMPEAALLRALSATSGDSFNVDLFQTPFGVGGTTLLAATTRELFDNDDPTLRQAAASPDRPAWQDACDAEYSNLESHSAYEEVPEDTLPSWDPRRGRAREVTDTLWVLKQKRDGKNEKTKKKGRICFNGAMQKKTAMSGGTVLETFAPTVRHTTFKLLAARGCVAGRRRRQFDVEGAYLKGKFEDGEVVYARPPPDFPGGHKYRHYTDAGVPLVWKLKVPLYGEADAGRIWNRTAVNQLVSVQGFTQSEYDPCYFYKVQDGQRVDIALYVDDGYALG